MGHLAQHTRTQHKESILFSALARKMMDTSESKVGNRASELPVEKLQIPVLKLRPGPKTRDAPVISTRFLYDDSLQWTVGGSALRSSDSSVRRAQNRQQRECWALNEILFPSLRHPKTPEKTDRVLVLTVIVTIHD